MEYSQPVQKNGRSIKKNMNSSTSVMYISVCPVSYVAVVMFTCTLVRSHPDSRRCWGETWTVVINSYTPGQAWQKRGWRWAQYTRRPKQGHEGCIREVPQEDCWSSMYIDHYAPCPATANIHAMIYASF
jgi:hypothetical protein